MGIRALAQRRLPATAQDVLRAVLDVVSPSRRRAAASLRADPRSLARVSPDGRVLAGPFAGMTLVLDGSWGGALARLAGTYEEELHEPLSALLSDRTDLVVDVGAAEGYYAVGIARALPMARVISFEMDRYGRRLTRRNAALNNVRNLRIRGCATPAALNRSLRTGGSGVLVLCDVEGHEATLIDPRAVPALRTASLLVELHEFCAPGITELITHRFGATHDVTLVDAVARDDGDRPQLRHLDAPARHAAIDEGRPTDPPMQWMIATPRPRR